VSHPARAARRDFVEVLDCSTQRASRPPLDNEVVLDAADGMDWPTFCKCDCIYAVPREEIKARRGTITRERRRAIVSAIVQSHGWNVP
jgi:hypothetical protein